MKNLNENIFWDRIADMPDVEAIQELNLRKDELGLENAMLLNEKIACKNVREAHRIASARQYKKIMHYSRR